MVEFFRVHFKQLFLSRGCSQILITIYENLDLLNSEKNRLN